MSKNIFLSKYRSFIIIIASLTVICIVGAVFLCVLSIPNGDDDESDPPYVPTVSTDTDSIVLKESADAGQDYINSIYFLGDSTTLHFWKGEIDRSHLLVPASGTLMLDSDILTVTVSVNGKEATICDAVKGSDPKILIITLGVNGAANFTETTYKTYYKKLVSAIKEASPDTKMIIQSVFPVTEEYEASAISNEAIDRLNGWGKEIAYECSLNYLDTQSILKTASGAMIPDYSEGDGVHMNSTAYKEIVKYIRTHPINQYTE